MSAGGWLASRSASLFGSCHFRLSNRSSRSVAALWLRPLAEALPWGPLATEMPIWSSTVSLLFARCTEN